jgi:hypothetical protein
VVRLKLVVVAEKEDAAGEEWDEPSRAFTGPLDFSSGESLSPGPSSARSEPGLEFLRASSESPMSSLASNLATMPICGYMGNSHFNCVMEGLDYGQMMDVTPTSTPLPYKVASSTRMRGSSVSYLSASSSSASSSPHLSGTSPFASATSPSSNGSSRCPPCPPDSLARSPPQGAVVPPFCLSALSPPVSPMPVPGARISPRAHQYHHHNNPSSPRLFHSSPARSLYGVMPQGSREFPGTPSDLQPSVLSTSFSSIEDFASVTDSSDSISFYLDQRSNTSDDCPPTQQLASDHLYESSFRTALSRTQPHLPQMSTLTTPIRSNSDKQHRRSRSRTVQFERSPLSGEGSMTELCSSPTRSRGGNPSSSACMQRTASFLNNPRPSINRTRRDSTTRPRPKPFRDSTDSIKFPVHAATSNPDLIPDLKSLEFPPPSPSRPSTKLPTFYEKGNITCPRISASTVRRPPAQPHPSDPHLFHAKSQN